MPAMKMPSRTLIEGLGLSILALGFSGVLLYAGILAAGKAEYVRGAAFLVPGAIGLYWAIRFLRAELARNRG
jgi:hypothetical protein